MPDLADGESVEMQGSASKPYVLKNVRGVYSCSCPAWRNQSLGIERRTCKHLRKLRGDDAEAARLGSLSPAAHSQTRADVSVPALLLADRWDGVSDPTGWWQSEKLDGVRAYWDGRQFLSRQGNRYHAPAWFVAGLPNVPLDGELWLGRKMFQRTVSIVRQQREPDYCCPRASDQRHLVAVGWAGRDLDRRRHEPAPIRLPLRHEPFFFFVPPLSIPA